MKLFLKIKHWQLFLILICLPIVSEIILIIAAWQDLYQVFLIIPVVILATFTLYFSWLYSLGTHLFRRLPVDVKMPLILFKISLFIPFAYIPFAVIAIFTLFSNSMAGEEPHPGLFGIILPLHFFSMFCIIYCMYFIAKALKSVEIQGRVTFSDFAGEFFMIWFFPIGLWILQPRINKIFTPSLNTSVERNKILHTEE